MVAGCDRVNKRSVVSEEGTGLLTLLAINECLRPNDIPNTIPSKQNGANQLFLGVACHIAANHRQAETEYQSLEIAEPKCHQPTPLVVVR